MKLAFKVARVEITEFAVRGIPYDNHVSMGFGVIASSVQLCDFHITRMPRQEQNLICDGFANKDGTDSETLQGPFDMFGIHRPPGHV
jgi:hypothetical protein